jgi:hypothetical protein
MTKSAKRQSRRWNVIEVLVLLVWIGLFCGGLALFTEVCERIADYLNSHSEVKRG